MAQIIRRGTKQNPKWLVRISRGRVGGHRAFLNKTIAGTKRDAQRWAAEQERSLTLGTFVEPSKRSVGEFLTEWLDSTASTTVTEETITSYKKVVRLYLLPSLGGLRLSDITPADVKSTVRKLLARGLAPRTVRYAHTILGHAMRSAVRDGLIYRDPTDGVKMPPAASTEMAFMSGDQVRRFVEAARQDRYYALWRFLVETGVRPGEALGLMWEDLSNEVVSIRRTLIRAHPGWHFGSGKTKRARRALTMSSGLVEALQEHRRAQDAEKAVFNGSHADRALVFATRTGSPPDLRSLERNHFLRILEAAGLPRIRLYDLRHTHASLLLSRGVPVHTVSERLGHASAKVTLDTYAHTLPEDSSRLAGVLESLANG